MDAAQAMRETSEDEVVSEDAETDFDELAVDLSANDLNDVLDELEEPPQAAEEELDLEDIAQAIQEAADEPAESLPEEIEKALDINDDEDSDDDEDDDDEEFNLEDFDIGDTDDLPDNDKKP